MDDWVQDILDHEDWDNHLHTLTLFAHRLMKERAWRGVPGAPVPGGREAADFAMEAIGDLFSGQRKWDPKVHPDLITHLKWVVRSKVSNAVNQSSNKHEIRNDDLTQEPSSNNDLAERWAWGFLQVLEADQQLERIAGTIMDGAITRGDIAEHLGLTPDQVTNSRKQLQRRLDEYLHGSKKGSGRSGGSK